MIVPHAEEYWAPEQRKAFSERDASAEKKDGKKIVLEARSEGLAVMRQNVWNIVLLGVLGKMGGDFGLRISDEAVKNLEVSVVVDGERIIAAQPPEYENDE